MLKIISHSERETMGLGKKIVGFLNPGDIVCLFGSLGAGKTVLVKGMAKGLGLEEDDVNSPSFVLINEYLSPRKAVHKTRLYHLDLFRLGSLQDIFNLGCEEYLYGQGICVIEWAERMKSFLPPEFLKIVLEIKGRTRRLIKLAAKGRRYKLLCEKLKIAK